MHGAKMEMFYMELQGNQTGYEEELVLVLGFKLIAGAIASCAFIGVAIGVGLT